MADRSGAVLVLGASPRAHIAAPAGEVHPVYFAWSKDDFGEAGKQLRPRGKASVPSSKAARRTSARSSVGASSNTSYRKGATGQAGKGLGTQKSAGVRKIIARETVPYAVGETPFPLPSEQDRVFLAGSGPFRHRKTRSFPKGPTTLSKVGHEAFGRDAQLSDDEYFKAFEESAGCASWVAKSEGTKAISPGKKTSTIMGESEEGLSRGIGLRHYPDTPHVKGEFASVVYGAEPVVPIPLDAAGAAGTSSWVVPPNGLSTTVQRKRHDQTKLRQRARDFLQRAHAHLARTNAKKADASKWSSCWG